MTDTTATFYSVTSSDGRIFTLGECRRVIRLLVVGVVFGLATVAAACALVTTVTVAAAWIINTALATNPNLHAKTPIGPAAIARANHYPTLASAADFTGSARVSTDLADALTFEAKWARATATAPTRTGAVPLMPQHPVERASNVASLQPNPLSPPQSRATPEIARAPDSTHAAELTHAVAPASAPASTLTRPPEFAPERVDSVPPQQAHNKSMPLPDPDSSRTAVYDIAAHTVYLPNGDRLEAHSGLGNKLDDPRYVSVKNRGPTPPNVYDLALRERLFHGVQAIRLNPVDDGKMFGRDGMLAHTYMLGPNGQSNGCVSFRDYPKFLHAVLSGEVDRLVVVPNLGSKPSLTARARRGPARRYADNNS